MERYLLLVVFSLGATIGKCLLIICYFHFLAGQSRMWKNKNQWHEEVDSRRVINIHDVLDNDWVSDRNTVISVRGISDMK